MNKHTPGPWSVSIDDSNDGVDAIEPGVLWGCGCCGSPNLNISDAHLIAAAPELLEVLIEITETLGRPDTFAKARAAIAKATGGQA